MFIDNANKLDAMKLYKCKDMAIKELLEQVHNYYPVKSESDDKGSIIWLFNKTPELDKILSEGGVE